MGVPTGKGNVAKDGDDYRTMTLMGFTHKLFLHSYLGFGLMAGRAAILKLGDDVSAKCIPKGSTASFKYGDNSWSVESNDADSFGCLNAANKAILAQDSEFTRGVETPQNHQPVFAMSYYFDRAVDVGLIDPDAEEGHLTPLLYSQAASQVCRLSESDIESKYPNAKAEDRLFLCMDLCFISTLLMDGFKLKENTPLNLAKAMRFNGERVETQWTLGAALQEIL